MGMGSRLRGSKREGAGARERGREQELGEREQEMLRGGRKR